MTVFELLIDWDGTTRSRYSSEGLYTTRAKAEKDYIYSVALSRQRGGTGALGGYTIKERTVE